MAFVKLFSSIMDSTIWQEPDHTRIVWITLMAMADRDGEIAASIPGLAARARVPLAAAEIALGTFLAPDKYSRTEDHEGRRLEKIDGGWRLLNYFKYRETRSPDDVRAKNTERVRKYRQRQAFYWSKEWIGFRQIRLQENPFCHCGQPATQVDHVTPIVAGGAALAVENTQCLCISCHSRKTVSEQKRGNVTVTASNRRNPIGEAEEESSIQGTVTSSVVCSIERTEHLVKPQKRKAGDFVSPAQASAFAEFWSEYPLKKAKPNAQKAYVKAILTKNQHQAVMDGLRVQLPGMIASEPQHRPHPASWLNARRWEDEIDSIVETEDQRLDRVVREMGLQ